MQSGEGERYDQVQHNVLSNVKQMDQFASMLYSPHQGLGRYVQEFSTYIHRGPEEWGVPCMPKQPRDITSGFYLSYQTSSQHSKVEMQKTKKPYCLPCSTAIMHAWETMLQRTCTLNQVIYLQGTFRALYSVCVCTESHRQSIHMNTCVTLMVDMCVT